MTKWKGWVTVHRGKRTDAGLLVTGEILAYGPTIEFEIDGDDNNSQMAREELELRWISSGRPVTAQWTDADDAVSHMNVEALTD